jgi:predicted  nucleic acid-binding Zn ribbon protein
MYIAEMTFKLHDNKDIEVVEDLLYSLFGVLRMNGQVLGDECTVGQNGLVYHAFWNLPERDSLNDEFGNSYVKAELEKLKGVGTISFDIIGKGFNSEGICECSTIESYILYTNYLIIEPSLRCGECFGFIPLYRIPKTYDDEYNDIICWESDYQACDKLQMNCKTGERFGYQQMSKYNSSLSLRGIKICKRISEVTGKKAYYFLYRYTALSRKKELIRKCPSCGGEWLLDESLHDLFDFRCDNCSLLSNISLSVRKSGLVAVHGNH